ncbi:MAG: helix-turn-helix domain-containing protein, partial [Blastocatellia bacterium]
GKKTAAVKFNKAKYRKLIADALPAIVETEAENERLLAIVEPMMGRELTPEEEKLFDLLVKLIEDFEDRHYPMGESSPTEMLQFLMEQRGLRQRDIVHLFGSSGVASEVINGKRAISKNQAKALAEFFRVSPELFI